MRVRNKPAPWLNSQLKEEMYERDWLKKKASVTQRPDVWKAYKTKKLTVNKKVKKTNIKSKEPLVTWKQHGKFLTT